MKLNIPYGNAWIDFEIPDRNFIGKMDPVFVEPVKDIEKANSWGNRESDWDKND